VKPSRGHFFDVIRMSPEVVKRVDELWKRV
jgi:hypothetical protein